MHLWTRLPDGIDDVKATLAARRAGVAVNAGRPFFPAEAAAPHVRITFSAVPSEADLETGVRRLARAIAGLERDSGD
jgi:DNA-binding transcriptional MocR family regulator